MQFSYLDHNTDSLDTIMGTLIQNFTNRLQPTSAPVEEDTPEVELSEDWNVFGEELANYQRKFALCLKELRDVEVELKRKNAELSALIEMEKKVLSRDLKASLQSIISDYQSNEKISEFEDTVKLLKGRCKSMKIVLENTNPEQMIKYQCFVCMDKGVDTFLDPCGHVLCSACWRRNRTNSCPACRNTAQPKKIYLLF